MAPPSSFRMYFRANVRPVSFFSTMRTFPKAPLPTTRRRRNWFKFTSSQEESVTALHIIANNRCVQHTQDKKSATHPHRWSTPVSLASYPLRNSIWENSSMAFGLVKSPRTHPNRCAAGVGPGRYMIIHRRQAEKNDWRMERRSRCAIARNSRYRGLRAVASRAH